MCFDTVLFYVMIGYDVGRGRGPQVLAFGNIRIYLQLLSWSAMNVSMLTET